MKPATLQSLSHSGVRITTPGGKIILVDPWTTGNPLVPFKLEEIAGPGMANLLLVTHDHMDHGTDIVAIAKSSGATVVAIHELVIRLHELGVPQEQIITWGFGMNIGGTFEADGVAITMVQAVHSAHVGVPVGFLIKLEDDTVIYHAGDTALFKDMDSLGSIDLALLPIGGTFTMGPQDAARAVRLIQPRKVVPIHYGTFPFLTQTAEEFCQLVRDHTEVVALDPMSSLTVQK